MKLGLEVKFILKIVNGNRGKLQKIRHVVFQFPNSIIKHYKNQYKVIMSTQFYNIRNKSSIPRYEQIYHILLKQIISMSGENEYLAYESDLSKKYGVSRNTIRRALNKLRINGYIETKKKSGSRILKRTIEAHRPIIYRETSTGCIAFIISNDTPDSTIRTDIRWNLINETERVFKKKRISMVVYNLREEDWTFWTPEKVIESLNSNGVKQVIIDSRIKPEHYPISRLFKLLHANNFQIIITLNSTNLEEINCSFLTSKTSFTAVNVLPTIKQTLEFYFSDTEEIIFVYNISQQKYAKARAEVCQNFAQEHKLSFIALCAENNVKKDINEKPISPMLNIKTAHTIKKRLSKGKRTICFCANDDTATSLLSMMKCPSNCIIIGFDNSALSSKLNFSSFDLNNEARAEALLTLYIEANPDVRGIITEGRFINRIPEEKTKKTIKKIK